jgi:hypothetical protein
MWFALAAAAFAGAPGLTRADLMAQIQAIQAREGEPTLLIGTTWGTNPVLKDFLAAHPEIGGDLRRVPEGRTEAVDAVKAALEKQGLRCGLWISEAGTDLYAITEVGSCRATAPAAPAPVAAATTAPAPIAPPISTAATPVFAPAPPPPPVDTWALKVQLTAPDPTAAFLQSAIIGFGSGHFYCNDPQAGYIHLGVQAGGAVLIGAGTALASRSPDAAGAAVVGAVATVVSRVVELVTVPYAARREAERLVATRR